MDIICKQKTKVIVLNSKDNDGTEDIFFYILDLLFEEYWKDNKGLRGFWCNRTTLLKHYVNSQFYVLKMIDDDQLCDKTNEMKALDDEITPLSCSRYFRLITNYHVIPAFCCLDSDGNCNMIWVHSLFRRRGFASTFVKHFDFKHVEEILEEAKPFWDSLKVTYGPHIIKRRIEKESSLLSQNNTNYKKRTFHNRKETIKDIIKEDSNVKRRKNK